MTKHPTALVTGSAGFIGRHAATALEAAGYSVNLVDLVTGRDALDVFKRAADVVVPYDVVVHCAAVVGGRTMIDGDPATLAAVDLELDAALWRYVLRRPPRRRLIYWSSSAAYPTRWQMHGRRHLEEKDLDPLHEVQFAPDQTYGLVKLVGERMAIEARAAGVPVTVLRPFSGYGTDQDLDYPFPSFIDRAVRRLDPFIVWGDGRQVRDFVHVDDIVATMMSCIDLDVDGPLNVCTGRGVSMIDLALMVTEAAGYMPAIEPQPGRPVGVRHRVGSTYRLDDVRRPQVSLEEGIGRALAAYGVAR